MATKQTQISANTVASSPVALNQTRRYLLIRNYANVPATGLPQSASMWVSFGGTATLGTAGELEILPGVEYVFGGPLPPSTQSLPGSFVLPVCPLEAISIITQAGTALGCIIEQ